MGMTKFGRQKRVCVRKFCKIRYNSMEQYFAEELFDIGNSFRLFQAGY